MWHTFITPHNSWCLSSPLAKLILHNFWFIRVHQISLLLKEESRNVCREFPKTTRRALYTGNCTCITDTIQSPTHSDSSLEQNRNRSLGMSPAITSLHDIPFILSLPQCMHCSSSMLTLLHWMTQSLWGQWSAILHVLAMSINSLINPPCWRINCTVSPSSHKLTNMFWNPLWTHLQAHTPWIDTVLMGHV